MIISVDDFVVNCFCVFFSFIISTTIFQLMTAGRGLMSCDVPTNGGVEGLELWINLTASKKFSPNAYYSVRKNEILVAQRNGVAVSECLTEHVSQLFTFLFIISWPQHIFFADQSPISDAMFLSGNHTGIWRWIFSSCSRRLELIFVHSQRKSGVWWILLLILILRPRTFRLLRRVLIYLVILTLHNCMLNVFKTIFSQKNIFKIFKEHPFNSTNLSQENSRRMIFCKTIRLGMILQW